MNLKTAIVQEQIMGIPLLRGLCHLRDDRKFPEFFKFLIMENNTS
jgi:hypothetical protein